ncbi:hypothetical protein HDV00_004263 [Rhizophlyctis rosea]|nr:hypothetical protein HDV00_004263 [Rhizophlyctis rosea]
MNKTIYEVTITEHLPPTVNPEAALRLLHDHHRLCGLQPLVTNVQFVHTIQPHDATPATSSPSNPSIRNAPQPLPDPPTLRSFSTTFSTIDPNTSPNTNPVRLYDVHERITLIPCLGNWASINIRFPVYYQNTENGVRAMASAAAGTTVLCVYTVHPGEDGQGTSLVEIASVECPALLMPFVKGSMEKAHREMMRNIVRALEAEG